MYMQPFQSYRIPELPLSKSVKNISKRPPGEKLVQTRKLDNMHLKPC